MDREIAMECLYLIVDDKRLDMIESGLETKVYLALDPFWASIILGKPVLNRKCEVVGAIPAAEWEFDALKRRGGDIILEIWKGDLVIKNFRRVVFSGSSFYTKGKRVAFRIEGIIIGKGEPGCGDPENDGFIIKLGRRI